MDTACLKCAAGKYSTTEGRKTDCDACEAGKYQDETGQLNCKECAPGFYVGSTGQTTCVACVAGSYCPKGNSAPAGACEAGYFCPVGCGDRTCNGNTCAAGYFCPQGSENKSGSPNGGTCSAGHYCEAGNTAATGQGLCDAGYYCPPGSTDSTGSGMCAEGHYCPSGSTSSTENECGGIGFYCPAGVGSASQVPAGYYSTPSEGPPGQRTGYAPCPAGTYSTLSSGVCSSVVAGYFCTGACTSSTPVGALTVMPKQLAECTTSSTCSECQGPCITDSDCLGDGKCFQRTGTEWVPGCSKGGSSDIEGMNICYLFQTGGAKCPKRHYCPESTTRWDQYPCPINTYSDEEGLVACKDCEAGKVSAVGQESCGSCPAGTYSNLNGTCINCDPGKFSYQDAAACSSCNPGRFSEIYGATTCEQTRYVSMADGCFIFRFLEGRKSQKRD